MIDKLTLQSVSPSAFLHMVFPQYSKHALGGTWLYALCIGRDCWSIVLAVVLVFVIACENSRINFEVLSSLFISRWETLGYLWLASRSCCNWGLSSGFTTKLAYWNSVSIRTLPLKRWEVWCHVSRTTIKFEMRTANRMTEGVSGAFHHKLACT